MVLTFWCSFSAVLVHLQNIFISEPKIQQFEAILKITCIIGKRPAYDCKVEYICAHLQAAVNWHSLFSAFTM